MRRQQTAKAWSIRSARHMIVTGAYIALCCATASALRDSTIDGDRYRKLLASPKLGKKGDFCGGFTTPENQVNCEPGLVCSYAGNKPLIADAPGKCADMPGPGKEGGICAGFAGFSCDKGLVCDGVDPKVSDGSGTCISAPEFEPGTKGGVCDGSKQINCKPGLTCKNGNRPGGSNLLGVCIKDCSICDKKKRKPVCAVNPDTKKRQTYTSPCQVACYKATSPRKGSCPTN